MLQSSNLKSVNATEWIPIFINGEPRYIQYQEFNNAIRFPRYTYAELPDPAKTTYGMCYCTDTTRTPKMQMLYASNDGLWYPVNNPSEKWKPYLMAFTAKFIPDESIVDGIGMPDARGYYNVEFDFLDVVEIIETEPQQDVCYFTLTIKGTILNYRFRYAITYDGTNATAEAAEYALQTYLQKIYESSGTEVDD